MLLFQYNICIFSHCIKTQYICVIPILFFFRLFIFNSQVIERQLGTITFHCESLSESYLKIAIARTQI